MASPVAARVSRVRAAAPLKGPVRPAPPLARRGGLGAPCPWSPRWGFREKRGTGEGQGQLQDEWALGAPERWLHEDTWGRAVGKERMKAPSQVELGASVPSFPAPGNFPTLRWGCVQGARA